MSEWPEEHSKALTGFLEGGMSRGRAADAINRQFKTSYTRNAIIGRAARMELPPAEKKPQERKPRKRSNAGPQVQKINRKRQGDHHAVLKISTGGNGSLIVMQSRKADRIPNLRCVEIAPLNLTFEQLEHGSCRYIYGNSPAEFVYCGHPKNDASSYCAAHHALCWSPRQPGARSTYREFAA